MRKKSFYFLLLLLSVKLTGFTQKIVFSDGYNTKNIGFDYYGDASIAEDSTTGEKVFIYRGRRELLFYQIDAKWKVLQELKIDQPKGSVFNDNKFTVLKNFHIKNKWSFVLESISGVTKETIDFSSGTLTLDQKFMEDRNLKIDSKLFENGAEMNILYLDNGNQINVLEFNADLVGTSTKLSLNTALPVNKSSKYKTEELFQQIMLLDNFRACSPYFTRNKIQFYSDPEGYSILISGEEPLAELTSFDKKTGKKLMSNIYSVADKFADKGPGTKYSTATLLFGNKLHILASTPSGGVYTVIDPERKATLFQQFYNEKDNNTAFNYGPVKYETLPATNSSVVKEKLEDITMNKFATELYKYSSAITAMRMADGKLLISLCNWDKKELDAPTSPMRIGVNTRSSVAWYVTSSAGLIFDAGGWKLSDKKTTWNELNKTQTTDKYKNVDNRQSNLDSPEYEEKKSMVIHTQYIGNKYYVVYLKGVKDLKIFEKTVSITPQSIKASNQ